MDILYIFSTLFTSLSPTCFTSDPAVSWLTKTYDGCPVRCADRSIQAMMLPAKHSMGVVTFIVYIQYIYVVYHTSSMFT